MKGRGNVASLSQRSRIRRWTDIEREANRSGDRVKIAISGRFLPYKSC
ncbi:hypothetical protein ACNHKD_04090 [Methylocystis sp. JAN1]